LVGLIIYKVSNQVWQQFDTIVKNTRMDKGNALEIALLASLKVIDRNKKTTKIKKMAVQFKRKKETSI
jgi:hypothetical protein